MGAGGLGRTWGAQGISTRPPRIAFAPVCTVVTTARWPACPWEQDGRGPHPGPGPGWPGREEVGFSGPCILGWGGPARAWGEGAPRLSSLPLSGAKAFPGSEHREGPRTPGSFPTAASSCSSAAPPGAPAGRPGARSEQSARPAGRPQPGPQCKTLRFLPPGSPHLPHPVPHPPLLPLPRLFTHHPLGLLPPPLPAPSPSVGLPPPPPACLPARLPPPSYPLPPFLLGWLSPGY